MSINYILSDWEPRLDEQNMDTLLKAHENGGSFPDVFDLPPYQALDEIFRINDSDNSIHTDSDGATRTGEVHIKEEIDDIDKMFPMEGPLCTGNYKQTETTIDEAHFEEDIIDMLKTDSLTTEPTTEEEEADITRDTMPNSTLPWDEIWTTGPPGMVYCRCCKQIADMKRQVRIILIGVF
jgi:hypothetical protein